MPFSSGSNAIVTVASGKVRFANAHSFRGIDPP
jgi:hypothetical protein